MMLNRGWGGGRHVGFHYEDIDCTLLAQSRMEGWAIGKAVMSLRVP